MLWKKAKTMIVAGFISVLLSACGTSSDALPSSAEPEANRFVTDALGNQVEIPSDPQRVIASYLEDPLIALGITPIAQWSVKNGQSVQDYLRQDLKDVETIPHDLPFEVVTRFAPDLIIMSTAAAVEGGKYDQYSKIAPTFVVAKETNDDWRENLRKIGEIFGLQEKAEQVLNAYEEKAEESRRILKQTIGDESAAVIWLTGGKFFIVSDDVSSGDVLYHDLGIAIPEVVKEVSNEATGNWSPISLEKLANLDADHLFLINSDAESGTDKFDDPLWRNIPAVKNGKIYEFGGDTSWLYSGAIANEQTMDAVLQTLTP